MFLSGMQATMVQCRCLDVDLTSASNDIKDYSTSLQKVNIKITYLKVGLSMTNLFILNCFTGGGKEKKVRR